MLVKTKMFTQDNTDWYKLESDDENCAIKQISTGSIFKYIIDKETNLDQYEEITIDFYK